MRTWVIVAATTLFVALATCGEAQSNRGRYDIGGNLTCAWISDYSNKNVLMDYRGFYGYITDGPNGYLWVALSRSDQRVNAGSAGRSADAALRGLCVALVEAWVAVGRTGQFNSNLYSRESAFERLLERARKSGELQPG